MGTSRSQPSMSPTPLSFLKQDRTTESGSIFDFEASNILAIYTSTLNLSEGSTGEEFLESIVFAKELPLNL